MKSGNSPLIQLQNAASYSDEGVGMFSDDDELGFRYDHLSKHKPSVTIQKRTFFCYSIGVVFITIIIGIFIGRATVNEQNNAPDDVKKWSYNANIRDSVWKEIKTANIRQNLKILTEKPHVAGSIQNEEYLVNVIKEKWDQYLDEVKIYPYDVLLSFPNATDRNYVGILYGNGTVIKKSNSTETPLTPGENISGVISAFNAYSSPGHVEGPMFYVNYARVEDFKLLQEHGVNVSGGVCIARYGRIFRGSKAMLAEKFHCAGLILYSDPADYANVSINSWVPGSDFNVYPHKWWLPPSGFQRGTINTVNGDPLTPGYPALDFTYRIPENETDLPTIPVQPISYNDAFKYLSILNGTDAPSKWQGGFKFRYKFGGSFVSPHADCQTLLHVANYRKRCKVKTVIGYIRGWLEPDRYVLFGNHRDAWTFGGADPSSGTAVVLEVSRAIGNLVKNGIWRPRRTIVFCNWAAEEYGLIGSTEWTEQMEKQLLLRAVAYVNIDIAVQGNASFRALATPSMNRLFYNVTKSVPNPNPEEIKQGRKSVYDTWLKVMFDRDNHSRPYIALLGSGSDYTSFIQRTGIASADIRYTFHNHHLSSYPVYHSLHDTFDYFSNFVDHDFEYSRAIAEIAADSVLQLSGSIVLPLYPTDCANKLTLMAGTLQRSYGKVLSQNNICLVELNKTISIFNTSAIGLINYANSLNSSSADLLVRRINDKLFYMNRGFLDFNGLPHRHAYRNVIFAPSLYNSYSGAGFPALNDAIYEALNNGAGWENVKKELSILCLQILSAAELMKVE